MFTSLKNLIKSNPLLVIKFQYSALLLCICFIFTFNQFGFEYLNHDDPWVFLENTRLHIDSLSEVFSLFVPEIRQGVVEYMPVKDVSLALDYYLFGLESPLVRLQSFIWYGLGAVFCFLFASGLLRQFSIHKNLELTDKYILFLSFLLAMAFVFHPAHVNSWAWISSRKDLLSGCFGFLFLWSYYVFRLEKGLVFLVIAFLAYVLALLSKPTAAFLPLVLFALELLYVKRSEIFRFQIISRMTWAILFLVFTVLFAVFYRYFVATNYGIEGVNISEDVVIPPYSFLPLWIVQLSTYIRMALLPYGLLVVQLYRFPEIVSVDFVLSAILVIVLFAGFAWGLYKNRLVAFGISFFIFSLMPTMATNPFEQYWATRYLFFGIFGILLVLWALVLQYGKTGKKIVVVISLGIAVLGLLGHSYSTKFEDSVKLWKYHTDVKIDHWIAYKKLGKIAFYEKHYSEAMSYFVKCSHFNPDSMFCPMSQAEIMFILLPDNEKQQAIDAMLNLVKRDDTGKALRKLALMYFEVGEPDKALETYNKGILGRKLKMTDIIGYAEFLWKIGKKELAYKNLDLADSIQKSWEQGTESIRERWKKESSEQQNIENEDRTE